MAGEDKKIKELLKEIERKKIEHRDTIILTLSFIIIYLLGVLIGRG